MYPQYVAGWDYSARAKKSTKENRGSYVGAVKDYDNKVLRPCGKCPDCLRKRALQWCFRLSEEQKVSKSAYFLTLTYDAEHLPSHMGTPTLKKKDLKKFFHTMRRRVDYIHEAKKQPDFSHYGKKATVAEKAYKDHKGHKMKYYAVGEYGTKLDRPHYHAVVFNVPRPVIKQIDKVWNKGFVKVGTVTPQSIRYVSNYIMHKNSVEEKEQEFAIMSNELGMAYLEKNEAVKRKQLDAVVEYNGHKIVMPDYYRNKIYIPEERHLQGERNAERHKQEQLELVKQLHAKGITFDQYQQDVNNQKWNKYFNNRKYKR